MIPLAKGIQYLTGAQLLCGGKTFYSSTSCRAKYIRSFPTSNGEWDSGSNVRLSALRNEHVVQRKLRAFTTSASGIYFPQRKF